MLSVAMSKEQLKCHITSNLTELTMNEVNRNLLLRLFSFFSPLIFYPVLNLKTPSFPSFIIILPP